jgi:hypothetical protein
LALGLNAAASWAAAGAGALSAAGCQDFGVFLAGRPGNFFALKKDVMLARPCAAAAASVFGNFLKGGIVWRLFSPPIANLKNASLRGAKKKKENEEKIRKNKKLKVRNNFVA